MKYNKLQNAVRQYIENAMDTQNIIAHRVLEDEQFDPTLISFRVYGSREHADIVRFAYGVDWIWQAFPVNKVILLPRLETVMRLKRQYLK